MISVGEINHGVKKGDHMENNKVNAKAAILGRNRRIAQAYGPYFGQQLYTIVQQCPDLKHKEDYAKGVNVLRYEPTAFLIKAIDVTDVKFIESDLDGRPKIVFNDDAENPAERLSFECVEPKFEKATRKTVMDAIESMKKSNSIPIFFAAEELPTLKELVTQANIGKISELDAICRRYMQCADVVREYNNATERLYHDYYQQCGITNMETVEVNVNVEVNE